MRRALVVGAVLALTVTGMATPARASDDGGRGEHGGGQPLPGYTVDNPALTPLTTPDGPTRVLQGIHAHAAYDVEVPPHWNGDLVMYAHGYRGQGTVLTVDPPPFGLREKLVAEGYAWAASSYTDNGYDVRSGVLSTHDLATYVEELVREPRHVYLIGVSMGGHVTGRSVEQYPEFYEAALPMCGVLGDNHLFDFFVDENLVAQDLAHVADYPATADYLSAKVPQILSSLGLVGITPGGSPTNALGLQYRSIVVNRSGGQRPGADNAFSFWYSFLFPFTLWAPDNGGTLAQNPGRLATNIGTVYDPNAPVDVNATVTRIAPTDAADRASKALTSSPRISGKPRVPVLTLHDLGDLFVPFSMEEIYGANAAKHHRSSLVVQRAIRAAGHCEFSPAEAGQAWDDLVTWAHTGVRPAGDDVTNPVAVASPTFGCTFTDSSAFLTGTRPLFAPCP
jgi:pimeloyl-ACP methyl ester carboxylesterase